jgi:diguanylate cyclase (GGDEF)-like protein
MKASTVTSIGAMALVTATATAAVVGNLRVRRTLASTRGQLAGARFQASHDALTGLANRAAIDAELARRLDADEPFALFLIDLDHFKPVNDTHGHPVGDLVLIEVARRLASGPACGRDVVGRLGGDEFVLIADSDAVFARGFQAPAICNAVRRPITTGTVRVQVTASVGLLRVLPGDDLDDCMASVDAAMYRAKAAGGDRCVDYGSDKVPLLKADTSRPTLRLRDTHPHRAESHPLLTAGVTR